MGGVPTEGGMVTYNKNPSPSIQSLPLKRIKGNVSAETRGFEERRNPNVTPGGGSTTPAIHIRGRHRRNKHAGRRHRVSLHRSE